MRRCIALAYVACVQLAYAEDTKPAENPGEKPEPIPWQGGLQQRFSRDSVRDSGPNDIDRVGLAVQIRFVVLRELAPTFAMGGHVGLTFEKHDVKDNARYEASYSGFDPGLDARLDLGRFAILGSFSYVLVDRSVAPRDFSFTDSGTSSFAHGPRLGVSPVVRFHHGMSLELGPLIEIGRLTVTDDTDSEDVDESMIETTSWKVGLTIQFWAGAPPP